MPALPRQIKDIARDPWKPDYLNLGEVNKPDHRFLFTRSLKHGQAYHRLPKDFTFDRVPKSKPTSSKYFLLHDHQADNPHLGPQTERKKPQERVEAEKVYEQHNSYDTSQAVSEH